MKVKLTPEANHTHDYDCKQVEGQVLVLYQEVANLRSDFMGMRKKYNVCIVQWNTPCRS